MGFGLVLTSGDFKAPLPDAITQWLVEVRVEMELSKPTRYALRFEDDICDGQPAVEGQDALKPDTNIGVFTSRDGKSECLVYGPVTEVKASTRLGGVGSWVEVHGEDRRREMARVGVQAVYKGKASGNAAAILSAYEFTADTQDTLIEYDEQKNQLTQRGTDLAFLEDVARRNNMELWVSYEVNPQPNPANLKETAHLRTSPPRAQPGDVPHVPVLVADSSCQIKVNPPPDQCPTVNKFDPKIDYEKPTSAKGFALSTEGDKKIVDQLIDKSQPQPVGNPRPVDGVKREAIAPAKATPEEAFLAQDAIVFEQSWFVEVECSATLEQLDFLVLPHLIVDVVNAGDRLSGAYQVMKATHVVTATDHFMDFTLRANGLGGGG
jgi:hypothetical protein